jgi:hypothetical protein
VLVEASPIISFVRFLALASVWSDKDSVSALEQQQECDENSLENSVKTLENRKWKFIQSKNGKGDRESGNDFILN